jgi:hypothetical protein
MIVARSECMHMDILKRGLLRDDVSRLVAVSWCCILIHLITVRPTTAGTAAAAVVQGQDGYYVARSYEDARAQATAAGVSTDTPLNQDEDVLDTWFRLVLLLIGISCLLRSACFK